MIDTKQEISILFDSFVGETELTDADDVELQIRLVEKHLLNEKECEVRSAVLIN